MLDRQFSAAISLAKILLNTREQFVDALRAAAVAQIETGPARSVYARPVSIPRCTLESHADDAIYAIGRDGLRGLEHHVRFAVDEIILETLVVAKNGNGARGE